MAEACPPAGSGPDFRPDEAFYRDLFEGAPHAYLVSDGPTLVTVNRAAENLLGKSRDALNGRSLADLVPLDSRRRFLARVEALRSGRASRIQDWQLSLLKPDGQMVEAEITVERVADESTLLRWLLRDVTERRRAEDAMRLSTARYRALVESAVDGILTIDSRGIIESVNAAAERIFGYAAADLLGRNVTILMPEPFATQHDAYIHNYLKTGERRIIGIGREVVGKRRDGSLFPVDLAVSEIRLGERIFFVGTLRDLTQRRETERQLHQLEEQMRQAQKMEAIGRLAGGVAHDFNTLLGSILGYTEMVLDDLEGGHPLHRVANQIHRAAERGAALTRQLLAFSRRQVLQPRILDLNKVVSELDELFKRLIPANIELAREPAPGSLPVRVDASQLEQVLMNLVVNAVDAMPRGGRLEVFTHLVPAGADGTCGPVDSENCVQLIVRDNGHGMDGPTMNRIFEPFFTTKEPGKGTGLGLSTVYGIVTQSGGSVTVESEVGSGTTFTICLPWAGELDAAPKSTAPEPATPAYGSEIILLVEDDTMFRELLAEVLEAKGYTVWQAADPKEAIESCHQREERPALLVTDMIMPGGMTGFELAKDLRRKYPHLKVLRMSGYTDDHIIQRIDPDDDSAFLHKPFSTRDFASKVRELLDQV